MLKQGILRLVPMISMSFLCGCETIEIDPNDSTPPSFKTALLEPTQLLATYGFGQEVGSEIAVVSDGSGGFVPDEFFITIPRQNYDVTLVFGATDTGSGISRFDVSMAVQFTCVATISGGQETATYTKNISDVYFGPQSNPGDMVLSSRILSLNFNVADLWNSRCTTWGQFINHNRGTIKDITVEYSMSAYNYVYNPTVAGANFSELTGTFDVANANGIAVDLDE